MRTSVSRVRMLRLIRASSGMMFALVPARILPTVSTTASLAGASRETTVCNRVTR